MIIQSIRCYLGGEVPNQGDVVSGEINLLGLDLSPYYMIRLYLSGLKVNADGNSISLQLELGGSMVTSAYQYAGAYRDSSGTTANVNSASASSLALDHGSIGNATGEGLSGYIDIGNAVSSLNKFTTSHLVYYNGSSESNYLTISGFLVNSGNITGFRFFCPDGGGSLTAGRVFLMGLS
jgi:hypothetical protein